LKKYLLSSIALLTLSVILISWGAVGHSKISESAALSFNLQMQDFQTWTSFLRDHASDADDRKGSDPTEGPKHYIDIDNYPIFVTTGRIPQTLDSVNAIYGSVAVIENGILPWATKATFDSLRNCFLRHDFSKAKIFAADLGHYVADGHMPLHITKNYNGQLTGATGIHSRYESAMVSANISQITYSGENIIEISDVNQYIFDYLYTNYTYVDSVLMADTYAKSISGGSTSSTAYKAALWNKTKGFTIPLFKRASHALAELIYTAWIQAGSPSLINPTALTEMYPDNEVFEQNTPNPFSVSTKLSFTLTESRKVLLQVHDINGNTVATICDEILAEGKHTWEWVPDNVPAGIYYLVLKTGKYTHVKKMVYSGGM